MFRQNNLAALFACSPKTTLALPRSATSGEIAILGNSNFNALGIGLAEASLALPTFAVL
ncbi:MAG: hypothetical protein AAF709_03565 [Pseudomonadota bacterium]